MKTWKVLFLCTVMAFLRGGIGSVSAQTSDAALPAYVESDLTATAALVSPFMPFKTTEAGLLLLIDATNNGMYLKYLDSSGTTIKSLPVDISGNVTTFCIDPAGNIEAFVDDVVAAKTNDKQTTMTRSIVTFGPDGKKIRTVSLGEITSTQKNPWYVLDMAVDLKGNIYCATSKGIEVFTPQGEPGRQLASYQCQSLDVDRDGMLYSAGYSTTAYKSLLEKIDTSSGKQIWRLDLGDMPVTMRLDRKAKTIAVLDQRYVTRYTTDGTLVGRMFDMKSSAITGLSIFNSSFTFDPAGNVYFITRKPGVKETDPWTMTFYRYARSTQAAQKKNVLTISHGYWYDRYPDAAISSFERNNPDWKVEYLKMIEQTDMNTGDTREQVLISVATELMAGRGADIVSLAFIPYRSFIDKGLLVNLDQMAAADKSFDFGSYRKNVLDAFRYKGALYAFPVNYFQQMLFASWKVLNESKVSINDAVWTWDDYFNACDQVRKDLNGDGVPDRFALPNMAASDFFLNYMLRNVLDMYYDPEKKTSSFTDPKFAALLNTAKRFAERNAEKNPVTRDNWIESVQKGTVVFFFDNISSPLNPQYYGELFKGGARILSLPGQGLRGDEAWSGLIIGLNKNSKNAQKAWEFLKLLLSEETQQSDNLFGFPINTKAYSKRVQTLKAATAKGQVGGGFSASSYYTFKPLADSDIALIESYVARIKRSQYSDRRLSEIVGGELIDFFAGKRTAEDTCRSLQDKVMTYLRE